MKLRNTIIAAALLAAPLAANAEPIQGLYLGAAGGADWHGNQRSIAGSTPNLGIELSGRLTNVFGSGFVGLAAVGWGFGNGLRAEFETAYRQNAVVKNVTGPLYSGSERQYSFMLNGFYDFPTDSVFKPYVGAGAGFTVVTWNPVPRTLNGINCCAPFFGKNSPVFTSTVNVLNMTTDADIVYSLQVMAGINYEVESIPGLRVGVQYRFFAAPHNMQYDNFLTITPTSGNEAPKSGWGKTTYTGHVDHSVLASVTYAFNAPTLPAPVAPALATVPASPVSRSYLVFFDWDKAVLTDRARQIVAEAAAASKKVAVTKIEVNGYTDTSGTPAYNKGLSVERAKAVMAELVRNGVPAKDIAIMGYGEANLLVATGANVREPQNRRVEIIIK